MIIIVDATNVAHISKHAFPRLKSEKQLTGVIYGFLNFIISAGIKYETKKFVFCWDGPGSRRREMFSGYKSRRVQSKDKIDFDVIRQFDQVRREILPKIGFRNVPWQPTYEADDLIAKIVMKYYQAYPLLVVSGDSDLWQLLSYCDIYSPQTKKTMTKSRFKSRYKIEPKDWAQVKAIAGCKTDDIPGILKVGEKRAIDYMTGAHLSEGLMKRINDGEKRIRRNKVLTTLPLQGTANMELDFSNEDFCLDNFIEICEEYSLYSMLKSPTYINWIRVFSMR